MVYAQESLLPARTGRGNLVVRPASAGDGEILFKWFNRRDSLAYKLKTSSAVTWEKHQRWFETRLRDANSGIWIGELNEQPAGQVRLQRTERGLVIDIYVDPGSRRRGVAGGLLRRAAAHAAIRWPGTPIVADVKHGNDASRALFLAAGYAHEQRHADHDVFRLDGPVASREG